MYKYIFTCFICCFIACKNTPKPEQQAQTTGQEVKLPPDFVQFYEQFHKDSVYQIGHITWPLQGTTSVQTDSVRQNKVPITFTQDAWDLHRPLQGNDYTQIWNVIGDGLIEETIKYTAADFGMSRRFAKIAGEWHLIFYSDMQSFGAIGQ